MSDSNSWTLLGIEHLPDHTPVVHVRIEGELFTLEIHYDGEFICSSPDEKLSPILDRVFDDNNPSVVDIRITEQAEEVMQAISSGAISPDSPGTSLGASRKTSDTAVLAPGDAAGFRVGDIVVFGRTNGEKTLGEILGWATNGTAKVRQLEARGRATNHAGGQVWKVAPSLLAHAPKAGAAATASTTEVTRIFAVGDYVFFDGPSGRVTGSVIRVNKKTVTVEGDDGQGYRVPPAMISLALRSQ